MRPLGPKTNLQIVQGSALHPLVVLKEDEVTSVENPPPTLLHSCRLNCYPSPAPVHLSSLTDNGQTVCVDTSLKKNKKKQVRSTLPFFFEVVSVPFLGTTEVLFFVVTLTWGLNNHNPQTQGLQYLQLISNRTWTLN